MLLYTFNPNDNCRIAVNVHFIGLVLSLRVHKVVKGVIATNCRLGIETDNLIHSLI